MRSNRLRELNKTSKGSKIFISFLIISVILLFGYKFYLDKKKGVDIVEKANYDYINSLISNNSQPTETLLIKRLSNSYKIKADEVFTIGVPDSSTIKTLAKKEDYNIDSISGFKKARINYFNYLNKYYIRSIYSEKNDLIYSNQIIEKNDLYKWKKFDELQQEFTLNPTQENYEKVIQYKKENSVFN